MKTITQILEFVPKKSKAITNKDALNSVIGVMKLKFNIIAKPLHWFISIILLIIILLLYTINWYLVLFRVLSANQRHKSMFLSVIYIVRHFYSLDKCLNGLHIQFMSFWICFGVITCPNYVPICWKQIRSHWSALTSQKRLKTH